ncbi:HNH endonuclease [Paenibacillus sp. TRM 82003]|nr:HNH endonuclease [Paenibacillus sp. TRM 82003]
MKEFAKSFYKSKSWRSCRDAYFVSQHGVCERCEGKNGVGKIVHHKEYLTPDNINDPSVSLNWELLELLCQYCHNVEHHGNCEDVTRDDVMFNQYGELVERRLDDED